MTGVVGFALAFAMGDGLQFAQSKAQTKAKSAQLDRKDAQTALHNGYKAKLT